MAVNNTADTGQSKACIQQASSSITKILTEEPQFAEALASQVNLPYLVNILHQVRQVQNEDVKKLESLWQEVGKFRNTWNQNLLIDAGNLNFAQAALSELCQFISNLITVNEFSAKAKDPNEKSSSPALYSAAVEQLYSGDKGLTACAKEYLGALGQTTSSRPDVQIPSGASSKLEKSSEVNINKPKTVKYHIGYKDLSEARLVARSTGKTPTDIIRQTLTFNGNEVVKVKRIEPKRKPRIKSNQKLTFSNSILVPDTIMTVPLADDAILISAHLSDGINKWKLKVDNGRVRIPSDLGNHEVLVTESYASGKQIPLQMRKSPCCPTVYSLAAVELRQQVLDAVQVNDHIKFLKALNEYLSNFDLVYSKQLQGYIKKFCEATKLSVLQTAAQINLGDCQILSSLLAHQLQDIVPCCLISKPCSESIGNDHYSPGHAVFAYEFNGKQYQFESTAHAPNTYINPKLYSSQLQRIDNAFMSAAEASNPSAALNQVGSILRDIFATSTAKNNERVSSSIPNTVKGLVERLLKLMKHYHAGNNNYQNHSEVIEDYLLRRLGLTKSDIAELGDEARLALAHVLGFFNQQAMTIIASKSLSKMGFGEEPDTKKEIARFGRILDYFSFHALKGGFNQEVLCNFLTGSRYVYDDWHYRKVDSVLMKAEEILGANMLVTQKAANSTLTDPLRPHRFKKSPMNVSYEHRDTGRAYTAGDDIRHIDWSAFARTDRFYIRETPLMLNSDAETQEYLVFACSPFPDKQLLAALASKLLKAQRYPRLYQIKGLEVSIWGRTIIQYSGDELKGFLRNDKTFIRDLFLKLRRIGNNYCVPFLNNITIEFCKERIANLMKLDGDGRTQYTLFCEEPIRIPKPVTGVYRSPKWKQLLSWEE